MILANESASAYYTSGTFTSKIFDPGDYSSWTNIIFDVSTSQLPNYDQSASWVNMSGNQLVFHMNDVSSYVKLIILFHINDGSSYVKLMISFHIIDVSSSVKLMILIYINDRSSYMKLMILFYINYVSS